VKGYIHSNGHVSFQYLHLTYVYALKSNVRALRNNNQQSSIVLSLTRRRMSRDESADVKDGFAVRIPMACDGRKMEHNLK
jgi:hypothetical protein